MKLGKDIFLYTNKDGRQRIVYRNNEGNITSKSYPRYVMEEYLGRDLLPNEQVHHRDENPLNNDISNLEVIKLGEHQRMHHPGYARTFAKCDICGRQFYWEGIRQRRYYIDLRRGKTRYITCSLRCAGIASHGEYRYILEERHHSKLEE